MDPGTQLSADADVDADPSPALDPIPFEPDVADLGAGADGREQEVRDVGDLVVTHPDVGRDPGRRFEIERGAPDIGDLTPLDHHVITADDGDALASDPLETAVLDPDAATPALDVDAVTEDLAHGDVIEHHVARATNRDARLRLERDPILAARVGPDDLEVPYGDAAAVLDVEMVTQARPLVPEGVPGRCDRGAVGPRQRDATRGRRA